MAERQHGVVSRDQLRARGFSRHAIDHRISRGRLHSVARGVYAVGRSELTLHGGWMAAVLSCGPGAVLSHGSAAALLGIRPEPGEGVEVSVRPGWDRRRPGIRVHRRRALPQHSIGVFERIPVTSPVQTLIDVATRLRRPDLERGVNEADRLNLVTPPALRKALDLHRGEPGVAVLRALLDRRTFRLTRSELERLFLPLAEQAGLPLPLTKQRVNEFEVDFYWPDLGLVVETDGLQYHRTPAEQARDRVRDQMHTAAGLRQLRFTHEQVRYEPSHVRAVLGATAARLIDRDRRPLGRGPEAAA